MTDKEIQDSTETKSIEKAFDSLKDLFTEIIQENKKLKEEVEKLKKAEEEKKRTRIEELKSNIASLEYQQRVSNMLKEILKQNSPEHWTVKFHENQSYKTPLDILIEQRRKDLYG